jgi:hypothetical protein
LEMHNGLDVGNTAHPTETERLDWD